MDTYDKFFNNESILGTQHNFQFPSNETVCSGTSDPAEAMCHCGMHVGLNPTQHGQVNSPQTTMHTTHVKCYNIYLYTYQRKKRATGQEYGSKPSCNASAMALKPYLGITTKYRRSG